MKKKILALAILLATGIGALQAQDTMHNHGSHQKTPVKGKKYTCTMHPEIVRNKPGKCPKCGMKLVAVKTKKVTKPV